MLQLRHEECLPARLHPSEVGYGCGPTLPAAMRFNAILKGHDMGHLALAAAD
jgi:hypothetical protein